MATSPARRPARSTAWYGVDTASATTARSASARPAAASRSRSTAHRKRPGTTTCEANPPCTSLPGKIWWRQMLGAPSRHCAHPPHGSTAGTTTARPASAGSPATTVPAISCPRVSGSAWLVRTPSKQKPRSVWQTPQPATSTTTSPGASFAVSTVRLARTSGADGETSCHDETWMSMRGSAPRNRHARKSRVGAPRSRQPLRALAGRRQEFRGWERSRRRRSSTALDRDQAAGRRAPCRRRGRSTDRPAAGPSSAGNRRRRRAARPGSPARSG